MSRIEREKHTTPLQVVGSKKIKGFSKADQGVVCYVLAA